MAERVDAATSYKITVLSLYGSVAVLVNHAFSVRSDYVSSAGEPWAFANFFLQDLIKYGFARIATPFFFCLSGFLLVAGTQRFVAEWPRLVTKRVHTLLVPYLFWSIASFLAIAALQALPPLRPFFGKALIWDYDLPRLAEVLLWNPIAHPLWFVRDLFLLVCAAPLFHLALRVKPVAWAVLAAMAVWWFAHYLTRYAHGMFFFPLGMYLAMHRPRVTVSRVGRWLLAALWLALMAIGALAIMRDGEMHPLWYPAAICVGLPAAWFLYDEFADALRRPAIAWLSSLSFAIYVTHVPIVEIVNKPLVMVLGGSQPGLFAAFVLTSVITLACCIAIGALLRSWFPQVYAVATGERGRAPDRAPVAVRAPVAPAVQPALT